MLISNLHLVKAVVRRRIEERIFRRFSPLKRFGKFDALLFPQGRWRVAGASAGKLPPIPRGWSAPFALVPRRMGNSSHPSLGLFVLAVGIWLQAIDNDCFRRKRHRDRKARDKRQPPERQDAGGGKEFVNRLLSVARPRPQQAPQVFSDPRRQAKAPRRSHHSRFSCIERPFCKQSVCNSAGCKDATRNKRGHVLIERGSPKRMPSYHAGSRA